MLKKLTKSIARDAAQKLANKFYDEPIKKALLEYNNLSKEIYDKYVPNTVLSICTEYKKLFTFSKNYYVISESDPNNDIEMNTEDDHIIYNLPNIVISNEDYAECKSAYKLLYKLRDAKSEYINKVSDVLFALSSFKRISENFPEALPYINFSSVTSIIPNYSNLRNPFKN